MGIHYRQLQRTTRGKLVFNWISVQNRPKLCVNILYAYLLCSSKGGLHISFSETEMRHFGFCGHIEFTYLAFQVEAENLLFHEQTNMTKRVLSKTKILMKMRSYLAKSPSSMKHHRKDLPKVNFTFSDSVLNPYMKFWRWKPGFSPERSLINYNFYFMLWTIFYFRQRFQMETRVVRKTKRKEKKNFPQSTSTWFGWAWSYLQFRKER